MSTRDALLVLPALRARSAPDGAMVLTRKFVTGVEQYVHRWPGPVVVAAGRVESAGDNLDHVEVRPADLPFDLRWRPTGRDEFAPLLRSSRIVLASLVDEHLPLAPMSRQLGVPLVYVSEYTLRTRKQIIRAETSNPLRRWHSIRWTVGMERRIEEALRHATGVQCNGTPTYEAYRHCVPHPLLYFDSRVTADMLASEDLLNARTAELLDGRPLRLAFSGRLIAMKGADHVPLVAAELKRLGVPFRMDICGGGLLEPAMRRDIDRLGLADCVHLRGVLDFHTELLPFIARHVDLFVCCHRQGDPSCTYLETMSCATPIAGYDNEAFDGVVRTSRVGWRSPLDDPKQLAARIAELDRDRRALADAARAALAFAKKHTFHETMQARVDHLLACCRHAESGAAR